MYFPRYSPYKLFANFGPFMPFFSPFVVQKIKISKKWRKKKKPWRYYHFLCVYQKPSLFHEFKVDAPVFTGIKFHGHTNRCNFARFNLQNPQNLVLTKISTFKVARGVNKVILEQIITQTMI